MGGGIGSRGSGVPNQGKDSKCGALAVRRRPILEKQSQEGQQKVVEEVQEMGEEGEGRVWKPSAWQVDDRGQRQERSWVGSLFDAE